jgi:hypothetical protein
MAVPEPVQLDRADREVVTALISLMEQRHLNDFNSIWKPMLEALDGEDAFWGWARKKRLAMSDERYEAYVLEQDDLTQGLLWLETQWHRSQWARSGRIPRLGECNRDRGVSHLL